MRTLALLLASALFLTRAQAADPALPVVVSSASPQTGVTADSLATIYGDRLASRIEAATSLPWPLTLGDLPGVRITDSAFKTHDVPLIYISPSQINLWIPPGVATGAATLAFPFTGLPPGVGTAALRVVPLTIAKVAPGLFSLDGSGTGIAAASALRVVTGSRQQGPVPVFQCDAKGDCVAVPIDVGLDAPVYLSLYGTGLRGASSLPNVVVSIGGIKIAPTYAGPQNQLPGLDQVNVPLPLTLRGKGTADITVTVDGVASNTVQIGIL